MYEKHVICGGGFKPSSKVSCVMALVDGVQVGQGKQMGDNESKLMGAKD